MDDRALLAKVFADLPVANKEYWMDSCDDRQSVPMAMLFLREAQKDVLFGLVSILDGGHCFSDVLDSNWGLYELDDELEPKRPVMMLSDAARMFDPDESGLTGSPTWTR